MIGDEPIMSGDKEQNRRLSFLSELKSNFVKNDENFHYKWSQVNFNH